MVSQDYTGVRSINVRSWANVTIQKGDAVRVKITGDDATKVKVDRSGIDLTIDYVDDSNNGNFTVLNNMSVGGSVSIGGISQNNTIITGRGNVISGADNTTIHTSGGKQIRIVDGEVFVNGVRVDTPESGFDEKKYIPIEIEIWCPDGLVIDCTLDGAAVLNSAPRFDRARIAINGSCSARLQAESAKLNVSGSGEVEYKSLGGTLKVKVAGSGDITAAGEFDDVEVSVSGSGNIKTSGAVNGDYEVDVSGMGDVTHRGTIAGRKNKSISGMGSVSW